MWILTSSQPGGETHYLLSSKVYVVGRKNCDILLPNDQSISRAHAHLTVADQTLTLKDASKYGTFVNSQRLTENTEVNLKSGDSVTFGVFHSNFSVDHQAPVVCTSCLNTDGKASLSKDLLAVGGKLVNTWTQDCTHLVMSTAKVTIKTISALLCCCPIVKPEFFSELSKAALQKLSPPKAESFTPEIDEPSLSAEDVNLGEIPFRKQLFTGKTFIFLSAKQLKRLSAAVRFGGGRSELLEDGSVPLGLLESPQSCVVDATTGSSQTLLPSSTTEWASSVYNVVQRKGLRVITESEIGLAAIYASCDKYCNASSLTPDSGSAPKMKPRIPSASLSQSVAVDETVLPAASQNITAYAVNTETSQGSERCEVAGVSSVGETPEKRQAQRTSTHCIVADRMSSSFSNVEKTGSQWKKPESKPAGSCIVADTMSSSFNDGEKTDPQWKKPEAKPTGAGSGGIRSHSSLPRANSGVKTFAQKQSPQKAKISAQTSPQKQSTLTSFFQSVNKKRPLKEDELFNVMSEPKRPNTSVASPELFSRLDPVATVRTFTEPFAEQSQAQSEKVSHAAQKEPQGRKRKEMEMEMGEKELEAFMSEDMDCFDERPSGNQSQKGQTMQCSTEQKRGMNTVQTSSSCKRQRVGQEENGTDQKTHESVKKEPVSQKDLKKSEHLLVSIKTEPVHPLEYGSTHNESSKPSASTRKTIQPFEDDDEPFIEDLKLLKADICQPKEETKTPLKTAQIKQEVQQQSNIDEVHPEKLVLVEFRSLTVTELPRIKPQRTQDISNAKNFKRFRKICVPGGAGVQHVIGGSDLLAHNRGKNSELDEWLKGTAEEAHQSKRDETLGDDLFRYNPTKLTKRR